MGTIPYCPALQSFLCKDADFVSKLIFPEDYNSAPPGNPCFEKLLKPVLELSLRWIEEPVDDAILTWYAHYPKSVKMRFDIILAVLQRVKIYLSCFHKELLEEYAGYVEQIRSDTLAFENGINEDCAEKGFFNSQDIEPIKVKESLGQFINWLSEISLVNQKRPPLGEVAQKIYDILKDLPEQKALTADQIADVLSKPEKGGLILDASTIRKRHLEQLKPYGLFLTGHGYCLR